MPKIQVVSPEVISTQDFHKTEAENVFVKPSGECVIIENKKIALLIRKDTQPLTII